MNFLQELKESQTSTSLKIFLSHRKSLNGGFLKSSLSRIIRVTEMDFLRNYFKDHLSHKLRLKLYFMDQQCLENRCYNNKKNIYISP